MLRITPAFLLVLSATLGTIAQTPEKRGNFGIGFNAACPQSELKDAKYDDGFEMNLTWLSRKFPYQSDINLQLGVRMDFGGMKSKEFEVELNTPVPDVGTMQISNSTFSFMGVGRINFGYDKKLTPYIDLYVGQRNYNTSSYLTANNPNLNPEYETTASQRRVVFTDRFHYGGGIGVNYKIGQNVALETSIAYTFGGAGAVMPLVDVTQAAGGNEIKYTYSENIKTDILLINAGFQFQLWKRYRTNTPSSSSPNNTPSNTRYKDPAPSTTTPRTSDPVIKDRPKTETKPKKKALEIKTDGPKKGGGVGN